MVGLNGRLVFRQSIANYNYLLNMKNAIIVHGAGGTPQDHWYPWLKIELEKKGYVVQIPQLPKSEDPKISEWLPVLMKEEDFSKETVVVDHSAGATIILPLLETLTVKIKQAILVSGYSYATGKNGGDGILKLNYDWEKIRENVNEIIFVNSDNDPWGCSDLQGRRMLDLLGGVQIVLKGQGHMGSYFHKQAYETFPLLSRLIP